MKRLIYLDEAIDALCDNCDNVQAVCAHYPCKQYMAIEQLPSAQPDSLVRPSARWMNVGHKRARICSSCFRDEPYKFADNDADVYDFCPHCGARMEVSEMKDDCISRQAATLYGYKIEHLVYIAKVMEKEGITAEYAARTFDDMSRAIRMILDETQQKVEEVTKRGYKVVHVSTDSIKVANDFDEPKSACSDCQEFDCYGCEHKEESK